MVEYNLFGSMINKLRAHPRKIIFPEGTDHRILEASARLLSGTFLTPVLIGNPEKIMETAEEIFFNVRGAEIIDPETFDRKDEMLELFLKLRTGKVTEAEARRQLTHPNYFGTMLLKMGYGDALLSGSQFSTADTVRPALQIIKTKPGNKIVSSCFILTRSAGSGDREVLAMADCAINLRPSSEELVEIAYETAKTARQFGIDPRIAFLSFSSNGSGKDESVDRIRSGCEMFKAAYPNIPADGEMQFDAAVSPRTARAKFPGSPVAGHANTFIFPGINSGNIGYKICQRMGGFDAYGPILQGLNAPINDLSRGCTAQEVYSMAIITAGLCED